MKKIIITAVATVALTGSALGVTQMNKDTTEVGRTTPAVEETVLPADEQTPLPTVEATPKPTTAPTSHPQSVPVKPTVPVTPPVPTPSPKPKPTATVNPDGSIPISNDETSTVRRVTPTPRPVR